MHASNITVLQQSILGLIPTLPGAKTFTAETIRTSGLSDLFYSSLKKQGQAT